MRDDRLWMRRQTLMGDPWVYHWRSSPTSTLRAPSRNRKCLSSRNRGASVCWISAEAYCTRRMAMRIWLRRCGFSSMLSARVPIGAAGSRSPKRVNKNRASAIVAKEQRGEREAKKERMKRQVQFRIQKTTGKEKKKTRNSKSSLLIYWSKKKLLPRFSASLDRKRQQKLFGTVQRMRNQILTLTCCKRRA